MDENKENQTPEGVQQQGELDWVQQYSLDQEREEQELQQALAQSLQEHVRLKVTWHLQGCSWERNNGAASQHCIVAPYCCQTTTCIKYAD